MNPLEVKGENGRSEINTVQIVPPPPCMTKMTLVLDRLLICATAEEKTNFLAKLGITGSSFRGK